MYAIIETGGKQYKVREGDTVDVELLGGEAGDAVELNQVLMLGGDNGLTVGTPTVEGAMVRATVLDEVKGDKVVVFKYKPKNRYARKIGHRQKYTRLQINEIITPGTEETVAEVAEAVEETPAVEAPVAEVAESTEATAEVEATEEPEMAAETATEETDESEAAEEPKAEVEEAEDEEIAG